MVRQCLTAHFKKPLRIMDCNIGTDGDGRLRLARDHVNPA